MSRLPIQVAVVSGKGGTGKTTVAAALAQLEEPVVAVDADVDAANLALLVTGEDGTVTEQRTEPFFAGRRAVIDSELCAGCGECVESCHFGALTLQPCPNSAARVALVDELKCEGCGVCEIVCSCGAVEWEQNQAGQLMVRDTKKGGCLIHAELGIAQDNSGKLVARVREVAREQAAERGLQTIIIDGPPGIGCPVHAAITGVDGLLAVTEPTLSGAADLERLLALAAHFHVPAWVLLNKADISAEGAASIERVAEQAGAPLLGRLPFDRRVPSLLASRQLPLSIPPFQETLHAVWQSLLLYVTQKRAAAASQ